MRRLIWTLVAVIAAGVLFFVYVVPPAPERLDASAWSDLAARTVPGAYHVHTTRSDGHGDKAAIAAAAAAAGLKFVILTDHGDGTRPPDAPEYVGPVLMLDAAEISTDEGHLVAIDMPRAPYPLGGAADAVIEDVTRLGGFAIAAHPDSEKPALRWTSNAAVDGIEWLNLDSQWRDESRAALALAGIGYFFRKGPALATLLDRPRTIARWDALTPKQRVVALAAVDAHGGVGRPAEDPGGSLFGTVGIPSYEASFRTFSNRAVLDRPLSGHAAEDAKAIYGAIRKGRVFTAIDALAGPALLDLWAEAGVARIEMGDGVSSDSDVTLLARALMPAGAEMGLMKNGRLMAKSYGDMRRVLTGAEGVYRLEIRVPEAPGTPPVPWLLSNPIYFGPDPRPAPPVSAAGTAATRPGAAIAPFPWRIEKDPASSAILRTNDRVATLEYTLAAGSRGSQFVALATDLSQASFRAIDLSLAGDRAGRVSVQVRSADGKRWGRSYYVDPAGTALHVPLSDLRPIAGAGPTPESGAVTSILLVVDLVNAAPGHSGVLRVTASALSN